MEFPQLLKAIYEKLWLMSKTKSFSLDGQYVHQKSLSINHLW